MFLGGNVCWFRLSLGIGFAIVGDEGSNISDCNQACSHCARGAQSANLTFLRSFREAQRSELQLDATAATAGSAWQHATNGRGFVRLGVLYFQNLETRKAQKLGESLLSSSVFVYFVTTSQNFSFVTTCQPWRLARSTSSGLLLCSFCPTSVKLPCSWTGKTWHWQKSCHSLELCRTSLPSAMSLRLLKSVVNGPRLRHEIENEWWS